MLLKNSLRRVKLFIFILYFLFLFVCFFCIWGCGSRVLVGWLVGIWCIGAWYDALTSGVVFVEKCIFIIIV